MAATPARYDRAVGEPAATVSAPDRRQELAVDGKAAEGRLHGSRYRIADRLDTAPYQPRKVIFSAGACRLCERPHWGGTRSSIVAEIRGDNRVPRDTPAPTADAPAKRCDRHSQGLPRHGLQHQSHCGPAASGILRGRGWHDRGVPLLWCRGLRQRPDQS